MAENYVKADGVAFADVASDRNEGWFAIAKRVLKQKNGKFFASFGKSNTFLSFFLKCLN
jgi:hypothetical protein